MPGYIIPVIAMALLVAVTAWVLVRITRNWAYTIRYGPRLAERYRPVRDPIPPARIIPTRGLSVMVAVVLLWAGLHLAAIGTWVFTGWGVERSVLTAATAMYMAWAAGMTLIGGVMMRLRYRYGRRAVSLGQFCLMLYSFLAGGMALLLPRTPSLPPEVRRLGPPLAAVLAAHVLVSVAVGALAQRVGRPQGFSAALD